MANKQKIEEDAYDETVAREDDEDDYLERSCLSVRIGESEGSLRLTTASSINDSNLTDGWFSILINGERPHRLYLGHDDFPALQDFFERCAEECKRVADMQKKEGE